MKQILMAMMAAMVVGVAHGESGKNAAARELSGSAALRGETIRGPGDRVQTIIHVTNTPSKPPKPPKPPKHSNENPPKGRYKHNCQRWAQAAHFRTRRPAEGRWTDAIGNRYYGPWQCELETGFVNKNRMTFKLRCDMKKQPHIAQGVHVGVSWVGEIVVKSAGERLAYELKSDMGPRRDQTHCAIESGKGWTLFKSLTTESQWIGKHRRPLKNSRGEPRMYIGKEKAYIRIPANPGQFFEMTLKNTAYSKWN